MVLVPWTAGGLPEAKDSHRPGRVPLVARKVVK